MAKDSTIRVKMYTKERIFKYSKKLNLTQNELIELLIDIGELNNFKPETQVNLINKNTIKEINRLVGFLKTQDKMIEQTSKNIEHSYNLTEKLITSKMKETNDKINQLLRILIDTLDQH